MVVYGSNGVIGIAIGFGMGIDYEDDHPISIPTAIPTPNRSGSGSTRSTICSNANIISGRFYLNRGIALM